jgi:hypothetical protein
MGLRDRRFRSPPADSAAAVAPGRRPLERAELEPSRSGNARLIWAISSCSSFSRANAPVRAYL